MKFNSDNRSSRWWRDNLSAKLWRGSEPTAAAMAFFKAKGVSWPPSGSDLNRVGDVIVHYAGQPDGPLHIHDDNEPGYYVLVTPPRVDENLERRRFVYGLRGWIRYHDVFSRYTKQFKGEPPNFLLRDAWVVPQSDLRSVRELEIHPNGRV